MPQSNQENVACLDDNDARLAVDPRNKYRIQTKPHGHGDVHSLLYSSGLLKEWHDAGLKWVLFFQDTNGLLFKAIPASLGVRATRQYQVNSLAIVRKAKEAIGGIIKLTHANGRSMVINVEYNQPDPLLRASGHSDGDVNCETGFSPSPGNINQLILELNSYIEELSKTGGAIKEFVNPKLSFSKTGVESADILTSMTKMLVLVSILKSINMLILIRCSISHVEVVGLPLLPQFDIEIPDSSEKCGLKYYPETETPCCTSSAST